MSELQQIVGIVHLGIGVSALLFLIPPVRNRGTTGSRSFAVFVVAVAGYAVSSGLDLFTADYALSMVAQSLTNCAGVLIGVSWLFLAVEMSERLRVTRRATAGATGYVLGAWLFALINPGGLVLNPTTVVGTQLALNGGVGFWFLLGTAWVQVLVGVGLLTVESLGSAGLRKKQTTLLALAITPALAASVATAIAQTRSAVGYDYTVFGWVGTMLLFAVALYSSQFLRLETVARRTAVEEMTDAMVTLDGQRRVVDANARAESMFDTAPGDVGLPAAEFFESLPREARGQVLSGSNVDTEITVPSDGGRMHISVSSSAIDSVGRDGLVLVFRDITDRYQRRERIRRERDLKETIRDILVQLSSRREIERAFCDRLLDDHRYAEVWIADRSGDGGIVPRTYASERSDPERVMGEELDSGPVATTARRALEEGEVAVDRTQPDDTPDSDGDRDARTDGETIAALPLSYNELVYGVLIVASRADEFSPDDRQLLIDLGESIAFAINAAEQQEALQGETVRKVVIRVRDPAHHLVSGIGDALREADGTEASVAVHEVRESGDGGSGNCLQFLDSSVVSADPLVDRFADHTDVRSVTVIAENGSSASLRLRVDPPTIRGVLADAGGKVRTLRVTDGYVEVVAEFSLRTDLDRVLTYLREQYQRVDVFSITTDTLDPTPSDPPAFESLTERQREALETAYHSGFFDRPQRRTAEEVAQELGIARSTFLSHVRAAEHEVLGAVVTRPHWE